MSTSFEPTLAKYWLASFIVASSAVLGCGDQKDPNESLNGGDTSSEPPDTSATTTRPSTPTSDDTSSVPGDTSSDTSPTPTSSDPSDTNEPTTGEDTSSPAPANDDLCPMVEGATWTYKHSNGWTEVQTVALGEYEDEEVFIVADTPNPRDNLRSDSYLTKRNGRVLRVYKEQFWVNPNTGSETLDTLTTYGIGFLRCDEAWASKEAGWTESPEYVRVETIAGQSPKPQEDRKHTFTVEGRENVTTSGGDTFANCVKVRRGKDWAATAGEDVDEKLYWFCPGVGKVREENVTTGKVEELTDYSIPN